MRVQSGQRETDGGFPGILVAVVCGLALAVSLLTVDCPVALAETISVSYPVQNQTEVPTSLGQVTFAFDHNVASDAVFGENSGMFYVRCSDGSTPWFGVSRTYSGGTPAQGDEDTNGDRRILYLNLGPLNPGVTYTLGCAAGIRSQGGHAYPAYSVTFATAGVPVEPDKPPDTSKQPASSTGTSALGGAGGSSTTGRGADQSGENGAGTTSGTSPGADTAASPSSQDTVAEASAKSGQSRAAGAGGGSVYVIGQSGSDTGNASAEEQVGVPSSSWWFALAFCLVAIGLVLLGMGKRAVVWSRHTFPKDRGDPTGIAMGTVDSSGERKNENEKEE